MAFTAVQFNANALYQGVNKVAHGFTQVGVVVRFDGTNFVAADNTSEANAEVVGIISSIPNVDQFYVTQMGFVSGLTTIPEEGGGYVPGDLYYLSSTPGLMTAIKPTAVGLVELPCYVAYSTNTGFFFASVGNLIESGTLFAWEEKNADFNMDVNKGYLINGGAVVIATLPPASQVGDTIKIATLGANGITVIENAGQYFRLADATSTPTLGGLDLLETNGVLRGTCELVCTIDNTEWQFFGGTGNWEIVL